MLCFQTKNQSDRQHLILITGYISWDVLEGLGCIMNVIQQSKGQKDTLISIIICFCNSSIFLLDIDNMYLTF